MARMKSLPLVEDFDGIPDEALIPKEEQPYPIPKHWKWVRLGSACKVNPSRDNISSVPVETDVTFVPMAAVSDVTGQIEDPDFRKLQQVAKGYTSFQTGDVLFAKITPCMENGKSAIVPDLLNGLGYGSTEFFVLRPSPALNSRFLHAFVRQHTFRAQAKEVMAGAVGQQRVPKWFLEQFPFPLPPLEEQQGIIEKLAENLQRIDKAVDRIEVFLEGADRRTESLLEAAIRGQLTEEWRNQRGVRREDWISTTLGESFKWSSGGTPSRKNPDYYTGDIPWVKSGELPDGVISETEERITELAIKNSSAKVFPKGSVAIAMYGATIGKVGILAMDAATNQAIAVARSAEHTLERFLFFYLRANRIKFIALGKGGAQPNISQKVIKAFPYELPSIQEQKEILRLIDLNLDIHSNVEALAEGSRNKLVESRCLLVSAALRGQLALTSPVKKRNIDSF
ncbi:restriction endonuclease subunit S [Corynebacterium sp. 32222D000AT]|uniref:restriction endonuclease subunit S n=1 Tax=unclassified Corynebacterium TaxID=2624378 RepID=UPI002A97EB1D|nr:restriction endonuclease subunit S [Mycobacteriaceae bacterium]MDY5828909.1 restriction endonuclease subunit S [Corynebacterium sp.]